MIPTDRLNRPKDKTSLAGLYPVARYQERSADLGAVQCRTIAAAEVLNRELPVVGTLDREVLARGVCSGTEGTGFNFAALAPSDQCDLLLGKSTRVAALDDRVDVLVKRFLKKAWRGRGRVAKAVQEVTGVEGVLWELGRCTRV